MATLPTSATAAVAPRREASAAQRHAVVFATALAAIGIVVVHFATALSMVSIWARSDTFAHGFVIIPGCLWLAWRKRDLLAATPAVPWWPGLLLVAAAGFFWLLTVAADVVGLRQFALVFMIQAAIVAVVGLKVARAAAFPLLFLLFAVPAGEFLLPVLIDWTADFTVFALRATGIPVFREANHFVIPSGQWSVVEACSGLRYLIASMVIGTIFAAISYHTRWRRIVFILASILVPLVANWLRAYLIVLLGHLSNNRLAVGVDHIIYGWVFFGLVMLLLFWVGSMWSEPDLPLPEATRAAAARASRVPAWRFYGTAVLAIALAGLWRPIAAAVEHPPSPVVPVLAPMPAQGGWSPVAKLPSDWEPAYAGSTSRLREAFASGDDSVGVHVAFYRNQVKGRELVTSTNQLVLPIQVQWRELQARDAPIVFNGQPVTALRAVISNPGQERIVAYRVFWVDGHVTGSEYVAKARLAWSRLRGGAGDAALIVFFAKEQAGRDAALLAIAALSPEVARTLDSAGANR